MLGRPILAVDMVRITGEKSKGQGLLKGDFLAMVGPLGFSGFI